MGPPGSARAYKACQTCREGKAKCIITAEEKATGKPCTRCRRQRRLCIFTTTSTDSTVSHSPKRQRTENVRHSRSTTDYTGGCQSTPVSQASVDLVIPTPSPVQYAFTGRDHLSYSAALAQRSQVIGGTPETISTASTDSLIQTIISNDGDALGLLFEATSREDTDRTQQPTPEPTSAEGADSSPMTRDIVDPMEAWSRCEYIRMGWILAEEAVKLVDLFFQNMAPFTPVLDDYFSKHENHHELVTAEPFLSCVILTISSRYHTMPTPNGLSKGYIIHERLWSRCQQLLSGIVLGQDGCSLRTPGSIQALVLLTEWQPRGLHADPTDTIVEGRKSSRRGTDDRWIKDSMDSAKKYDTMSWMTIGVAMSLAHELGVFDRANSRRSYPSWRNSEYQGGRGRVALASLLHTYQCQLATRLGRESTALHGIGEWPKLSSLENCNFAKMGEDWGSFMSAWTELTMIVRSISDVLFPSTRTTREIFGSGRYISVIDNFQSLLAKWEYDHIKATDEPTLFQTLLNFEYQSAKIFANSLGLQAAVKRHPSQDERYPVGATFALNATEHRFVQPLVDGCLETLEMTIGLAERGTLRFVPVRVFLRITTASVFLLKYLGLEPGASKIKTYIDVLRRVIEALKRNTPDDLHLGSPHAALLEMHVRRFQGNLAPATGSPSMDTRPTTPEVEHAGFLDMLPEAGGLDECWFDLDPSLGSLLPEDDQCPQVTGGDSLGFWGNIDSAKY